MKKKFGKPMGLKWRIENDPQKREESILNDVPVRFDIRPRSTRAKPSLWDGIRTFDSYGKTAVREHDGRIHKYAQKHNIDPDLVRSVMYAENARGHYILGNDLADRVRMSDSALPMNIQKERWSPILGKRPEDMYDSDTNVESSALLLKRITQRVDKPTPEKVGSIWHYLGNEEVDDFGEYVGDLYREKPWRIID